MKLKSLLAFAFSLCLFHSLFAADPVTATQPSVEAAVKGVIAKIQEKAGSGKRTEEDFGPELKELDAIIANNKDKKSDEIAQIYLLKASIYAQVFQNNEKALEIIQQIKTDLPDTPTGQHADEMIKSIKDMIAADEVHKALKPGTVFPAFAEKDLSGAPLSPNNYKGKIVMIDFWATWCGPCVEELPNVVAAYEKYHDKGFEIIGISLDKDEGNLSKFVKEHKMSWPQYFDGRGWESKLASQYGIKQIPSTFLLDREGKIIAADLRGPELQDELAKQLK